MLTPTKILIHEILDLKKITLRKLASKVKIKPTTVTRILSEDSEICSVQAYKRILAYKNSISQGVN
ncbi:MAG: hypothetical protein ACHQAX_04875 [Gammaproteobacteria bacterium]